MSLEMELAPIGFLRSDSLSGVADSAKGLARDHADEDKPSYWQIIFLQSKANGCFYGGEDLPLTNWAWPENTWFQARLNHLKNTGLRHIPIENVTAKQKQVNHLRAVAKGMPRSFG